MDAIDQSILEILSENAKLGTKEIAAQVGLTITPTYERIKRLEREGIIRGYTVQLDRKRMGKEVLVFCQVSLIEHQLKMINTFEDEVIRFPEVTSCYHIAGDHDYVLLIEVASMEAYEEFLRMRLATIPSIGNVKSSFVMREIEE